MFTISINTPNELLNLILRLSKKRIPNITVLWKPAHFVAWQRNGYWVMLWILGVGVWKPGWTILLSKIFTTDYLTVSSINLYILVSLSRLSPFLNTMLITHAPPTPASPSLLRQSCEWVHVQLKFTFHFAFQPNANRALRTRFPSEIFICHLHYIWTVPPLLNVSGLCILVGDQPSWPPIPDWASFYLSFYFLLQIQCISSAINANLISKTGTQGNIYVEGENTCERGANG